MKRGELLPSQVLVGFGFFIVVIFTGLWFVSGINQAFPGILNSDDFNKYNATLNAFDDYKTATDELETSTQNTIGKDGLFGFLNSLIDGAWATIRNLFSTLRFIPDVMVGLGSAFGLPVFIASIFVSIFSVIITVAVLGAIFQKRL